MKSNEVGTTLKHPETINGNVKWHFLYLSFLSFYFKNLTLPLGRAQGAYIYMFLIFNFFFKSYWAKQIWGDFQESPFQGGTSRRPPFGESPPPPWGVASPQVPPRPPKKGTWGNVPPGVPPSRGRGERVPCVPHPGGRVPVEHCLFSC
jgi:hypothetical protein